MQILVFEEFLLEVNILFLLLLRYKLLVEAILEPLILPIGHYKEYDIPKAFKIVSPRYSASLMVFNR